VVILFPGRAQSECDRAALDAVDAEDQIEQRADARRQPRQADPTDDGADMAFAQHRIDRDGGGCDGMRQREHEGPGLVQNLSHAAA